MFGKTKAQRLAEILEQPYEMGAPPESAIRDLRGRRGQAEVAMKSGLSQQMISELERGTRHLTPEVAQKLAPALGVTASDLQTAEQASTLQRMALKGQLDPQRLLEAIQELAYSLPDSEVSDNLVDSLLEVLRKALETYDEQEETAVATKTKKPEGTRDASGRRRNKPYGGR